MGGQRGRPGRGQHAGRAAERRGRPLRRHPGGEVPLRDLESLAARCPDIPALAAAIAEEYKDSRPGSATALARKLAPLAGAEQEEARKKLLVVVRGDYPLAERLLPFSGLIRTDLRDLPVIVLPGRRRRPSGHRTSRQTK